jgi:hypothetical protein
VQASVLDTSIILFVKMSLSSTNGASAKARQRALIYVKQIESRRKARFLKKARKNVYDPAFEWP